MPASLQLESIPCLHFHGPWPPHVPSLSPSSPLLTHSPSAVENCVSFSMFSFLVFRFSFFYFLLFFVCFFVCFSPISLPVYLHSRSFLPSLPCARLDFGFSSSISISISLGSAAAQLQLAPLTWPTLPTSALAAVSCVLFYLHLFVND